MTSLPSLPPGPRVAVDVILFTLRQGRLEVLLVERAIPPAQGQWALPGGFVRVDESVDDAARRELAEETGLAVDWIEQLYTFGSVDRDPYRRVVSVAYFALVDADTLALEAGTDAAAARWRDVYDLPELAFDHAEQVRYALERLRFKLEYAPAAFTLLPARFTLSELQEVYEVVLGKSLDKRNFRRKVSALGILEPTGETRQPEAGRPAQLYRFASERFDRLGGGVVLAF